MHLITDVQAEHARFWGLPGPVPALVCAEVEGFRITVTIDAATLATIGPRGTPSSIPPAGMGLAARGWPEDWGLTAPEWLPWRDLLLDLLLILRPPTPGGGGPPGGAGSSTG